MNTRNSFPHVLHERIIALLVVLSVLLLPFEVKSQEREPSMLLVIVQAVDVKAASQAVEDVGGVVTRELDIINAVAAAAPDRQIDALRSAPGVTSVWLDTDVQSADSADPGVIYSPRSGKETGPAGFDTNKVSTCDGSRENMDYIPKYDLDPDLYQTYSFTPSIDPSRLPNAVRVHFVFKEKSLNQAQLQVFQSSTRTWHPFGMDTLSTNDSAIEKMFDLSGILTSPEDFAKIEVRFLVSRNDGGEKAEVDCINLYMDNKAYPPSTGSESKPVGIDLQKISNLDGNRESLEYIPAQELNLHAYQKYTFYPNVDPANLPGLVDLKFVFKEKGLQQAQLQVYQASTRTWHALDIDTLGSEDMLISSVYDLTDILESPEDFMKIEVRFLASRIAGGEKAEVDLISLRLAELIGNNTLTDVAASFEAVNASPVWSAGNRGGGVGIAVLDSGVKKYRELESDVQDNKTGLENGWNAISRKNDGRKDKNGHGTLIASIISNREHNSRGKFFGVSPDSTIVPIQVLDKEGKGSYSQVIDGIQWAIDHKDEYNIRVMNLSLSAPVRSHYWADPLNQAVMKAWLSGIVVVVAAGNGGPDPMSIGVPGNNPYVITVGALTDAYTPDDWSDDYVPNFSAAGPTYEGFVKPDLVAPGGHIVGLMSDKCELAKEHPNQKVDNDYYTLTGTSMSAAQISGVVALMLAHNPDLTPDQVKYRLLASAIPAVSSEGRPVFSIWQQGAGRVDAYNAVYGNFNGSANQGLDLNADLAGIEHFAGFTLWNPDTNQFYLGDQNGQPVWDGYTWGGGVAWSEAYTWGGGVAWSEAYTWGGGVAWSEAYTWGGGVAWSEAFTLGGGVAWSEAIPWNEASASLVSWVMDE